MTNVTLSLSSACAGGDHITLSVAIPGVWSGSSGVLDMENDLLSPLTQDDIQAAIKVLLRVHAIGKSRAQLRSDLQAGIAMAI